MCQQIRHFLTKGLWKIRSKNLSRSKRIGINTLRVIVLAAQDFIKDRCQLRASANLL